MCVDDVDIANKLTVFPDEIHFRRRATVFCWYFKSVK